MKFFKILFLLVFLSSMDVLAAEPLILTEPFLMDLVEANPPSVQQIEASFLAVQRENLMKKDQFSFRLEGAGSLYHSDERLLNDFDGGVIRDASSYSLGLVKPTRYGVDVGLKVFGEKTSNAFVTDASASGATLSLTVDLFRNFLGRQTNNDLKRSQLSVERAELEKKSSLKTFKANIQKLYWSLVANSERQRLLQSLIYTADKQYRESQQRNKAGVADSAEVARFQSVLTSRKADLFSVQYEEAELYKSLKSLLPKLNYEKVTLGKYNVDRAVKQVIACTEKIASYPESPFEFTVYDEIVNLLKQEEVLEQKVVSTYNGPDITLNGQISTIGRGFGYEASREDFFESGQPRSSVGVNVSIPLGGSKTKTKKATQQLQKNRYLAEADANLAKIDAYHDQTVKLVRILKGVLSNQSQTNQALTKSLKTNQKKYQQARIGLQDLISEQDALLQSKFSEIDSNLAIIHTVIDYLSIYMDMPCEMNS